MAEDDHFDDIEVVSVSGNVGIEASNLTGATGFNPSDRDTFEGVELLDYDEIVDRNEELVLLSAFHSIVVYVNSTSTADGTVACAVEVSADPAASGVTSRAAGPNTSSINGTNAVGNTESDDSIDIIGRVLHATGHAPFSDGATGVGGAGSAGEDEYSMDIIPGEFARFHPRDELFMNGRFVAWNISDAGVHVSLSGQHVYGVVTDD